MQNYKTWVASRLDVRGPLGDIARTIHTGSGFPDSSDREIIRKWLINAGASDKLMLAFTGTWKWYLADAKKKPGEASLEQKLVLEVERRGGLCWKFVSPGTIGVPDRIVIAPDGRIIFVEMKGPTGKLHPMQRKRAKELADRGADWRLLKSNQDIGLFIQEIFGDEI